MEHKLGTLLRYKLPVLEREQPLLNCPSTIRERPKVTV